MAIKEVEDRIAHLLKPLDDVADAIEGVVHGAMDNIPRALPPGLDRILTKADQDNLTEAVIADLIELVPIAGPIVEAVGGAFRLRDAASKGQMDVTTRVVMDALLPLPINTRRYIAKKLGKAIR